MDKESIKLSSDLEFNDGLGDLLREKERLEFSWIKTATVFIFILSVIIAVASLLFKSGKTFFKNQSAQAIPYDYTAPQVAPVDDIKADSTTASEVDTTVSKTSKNLAQSQPDSSKTTLNKSQSTSSSTIKPINSVKKSISSSVYKFKIIAGTYKGKQNALKQVNILKQKGFDGFVKIEKLNNGSILYKVQAGAFKTNQTAQNMKDTLEKAGIDSFITTF